MVIYNVGSGILRAVGDSKRPFYFLAISAITNTVLDFVFVLWFGMGVEGVAIATVIAQMISAILTIVAMMRTTGCVKLEIKKLKIHKKELLQVTKVSLPVAMQMVVTSFSNVFVQAYINHFGAAAMGGWTAYSKLDHLVFLPMQSASLAVTTFVGQNLGIGNVARAKKGVNVSLWLAFAGTIVVMIPIIVFAPRMVWFFNKDPAIIEYGTIFLHWLTPCYVLCCMNQIYAGALRGAGNATAPMLLMLGSFVGFRQVYLFVTARFISNTIVPIAMSYPAGWFVCSIVMFIYYKAVKLEKSRIVK
jgi:putative MATE family efflux protein